MAETSPDGEARGSVLGQARAVWRAISPFMVRYAAAWTPLACAYLFVFVTIRDEPLGVSVSNALTNIVIPFLLGLPVMALTILGLSRAGPLVQMSAHTGLSLVFSVCWLRLLELTGAVRRRLDGEAWRIIPFPEAAVVWQVFQGLTVYFMVAAGSYVIALLVNHSLLRTGLGPPYAAGPARELGDGAQEAPATPPGRIFLKDGADFTPLDVTDVVSVHGASDYCEIATRRGAHMVRATLGGLEERLASDRLLRVHRSHLVNVDAISSVEPRAGGGYVLIMVNGARVPCSRTGAKAIQPFLFS